MGKKIAILGCGFVGLETARLFHAAGWETLGITHTSESAAALSDEPFRVLACDLTSRETLEQLRTGIGHPDAVIHCASSGRGGADAYRRVYLEGLRNALDVLQPGTVVFTSSTSVYAQTDGSEVKEESAAQPERETGQILREAEKLALARPGFVARLAGIYGPGRSALLQKFFDGRAVIEGNGARWLNHIHRDDAASALFFLLENNALPGIYNVSDDTPLTQLDCHRWLASHFQKQLPPFGPIDPHRKRGWTNKRVSNQKLHALGWRPRFASFPDALLHDPRLVSSMEKRGAESTRG